MFVAGWAQGWHSYLAHGTTRSQPQELGQLTSSMFPLCDLRQIT